MIIAPNQLSSNQLSPEGIFSLVEEGKKDIILQILDPELFHTTVNTSPRFKVFISDGFFKQKVLLGHDAAINFQKIGAKPNCIVLVKEIIIQVHLNRKIIIILNLNIIDSNVENAIGEPTEFGNWMDSISKNTVPSNNIEPKNKKTTQNYFEHMDDDSKFIDELDSSFYIKHKLLDWNQSELDILEKECMNLNQLFPYSPFIIKVRIKAKGSLLKSSNPNNTIRKPFFSVNLIDKEGNEMSATFIGESALHFFPRVQKNRVYIIRYGEVEIINPKDLKYAKNENQQYRILFKDSNTFIAETRNVHDIPWNVHDIPWEFSFTKISKIIQLERSCCIDIVGFLEDIKPCKICSQKKILTLYDDAYLVIEIKIAECLINDMKLQRGSIIFIKDARFSNNDGEKVIHSSNETRIFQDNINLKSNSLIQDLLEWKEKEFDEKQLVSI